MKTLCYSYSMPGTEETWILTSFQCFHATNDLIRNKNILLLKSRKTPVVDSVLTLLEVKSKRFSWRGVDIATESV